MSNQTENVSQRPSWLSNEYLGKIFSDFVNRGKVSKEIIEWNVDISQFTKDLDNLSTILFRLKITNRKNVQQTYSAFVKILCYNGSNNMQLPFKVQEKMFEREGRIYEEFLSATEKLNINGFNLYFPQLYHFSMDPIVLVVEDMSQRNFETDYETYSLAVCGVIFENIGKFHALSYYMHHEMKKDLSIYNNFISKEIEVETSLPMVLAAYKLYTSVVSSWEGCEEFAKKLKKFEPYYCKALCNIMRTKVDSTFQVLTHGDCHKLNYLFRNNKKDCVIIDHQTVSWNTPAYDLIASFNIFCEPDDNVNSRDLLLKCYHDEFEAVLKKLGFSHKIPTLIDVHKEVQSHGLFDLLYWSLYCPIRTMDTSLDNNMSYIELFRDSLNHPRQMKLSKLFPTILNNGYLDIKDDDL